MKKFAVALALILCVTFAAGAELKEPVALTFAAQEVGTGANTLFYFIVFGALFSTIGGGQLLIDMGMKVSNKSSGGPAKAAVLLFSARGAEKGAAAS